MAFVYETIDGQRVETNVASAFRRMAADFKRDTGCSLHIRSGTRTDQEQIDIFLSRYVTAGQVNGRKVYDTRVWNGVRYYRVSSAGTVAVPGTSNHQESGPNGPRSIDIYDSGSDAGVTRFGTARDKWMQQHAGEYGFDNEGNNFSEPWHKTYRGTIGGSGGGTVPGFSQLVKDQQAWMMSLGIDMGPTGADGIPGNYYYNGVKKYQEMLRPYGYTGDIDGQWGPATQEAHAKLYAEKVNPSATPPFPLALHQWFGPEAGGPNSISGWHSHREDLKRWQQRMKDRGWPITVDGLFGPKGATTPIGNTADIVGQFQAEKNLKVDKLIGPVTWRMAWEAPITPPTTPPVTPPVTPPAGVDEATATPNIKTPTAADYPSWIRYEEKFDHQMMANPNWNADLQKYYGVPYKPIESHTHWWGEPGKSGTHDGNVDYLNRTEDVGPNFVVSAGRVTLTCPLNKNAVTTGKRNPYAWKTENDPNITVSEDDLGYRTLGFLHYLVEKLNPELLNEPIRLHKEFYSTDCSDIDTAKVRAYAEKFRTGELDPATGKPPVVVNPDPDPEPEMVLVRRDDIERVRDTVARWL